MKITVFGFDNQFKLLQLHQIISSNARNNISLQLILLALFCRQLNNGSSERGLATIHSSK